MLSALSRKNAIQCGDEMKRKKMLLIVVAFIGLFFCLNDVSANDVCTECEANGTPCYACGRYCDINDKGICAMNSVYTEWDEFQKCLGNAKTEDECNKCEDAVWNYFSNKCVPNNTISKKKVSCGSGEGAVTKIPKKVPELTSMIFTIIQIAIPIILTIMGSIDLFKGITAGKEDEMKKGQHMFIKRLVVGSVIFFVVVVVKFLISIIADTNVNNMVDCVDCFVSNKCGYWFD